MEELTSPPEGTQFGSGWISGALSLTLGMMGFAAVLCLRYPALLTSPHLREVYPVPLMRVLIHTVLVVAFAMGVISVILRRNKTLGGTGLAFSMLAALLGGAAVDIPDEVPISRYLGLDWFLLDLFLLGLIFIPLERLFYRVEQKIFRFGWNTDMAHFMVSHVGVQAVMFLTMAPAQTLFSWAGNAALQSKVASQPAVLQFLEVLLLADLAEYWIHRAFHAVPWLWRFHAIHHSSIAMDWLAGSRLHLLDIVVTRSLAFVPLYVLGFSNGPVYAYLIFVSFHAVFVHANVRFRFGGWKHILGTPQFHHWHHAVSPIDKNFAIHLPLIDRIFGTLHLPGEEWPESYGIKGGGVPEGYGKQLIWPIGG